MKNNLTKGKDKTELKELLVEKVKKLQDFKLAVIAGRAKDVKEGRETRKDIARILTSLNNTNA